MSVGGVLATMNFPSFPSFSGRLFMGADDKDLALGDGAGLQRLAHRRVVRLVSRPVHPDGAPSAVGSRSSARPRSGGSQQKGCHSMTFTENPATLGLPSFHDEHWDPMWKALVDEGNDPQRPPRFVGTARGDRGRRADRRDDHAPADEHLRGRRRPRVVAGVPRVPRPQGRTVGRRDGLDPVLPRPPRPHLRHAPPVDRPGVR